MTCAPHLVDDLRGARAALLAACDGLDDAALRRRPPPRHAEPVEAWTVIELLAHLPDVDRYYLSQAQQLRDVPGHAFSYFDEDAWARDNADAIERDAHALKQSMAAAHRDVVRWAGALTPEELDRAGGHPRRGSITVREMLQRIANHDRTHTEQVLGMRRALAGE